MKSQHRNKMGSCFLAICVTSSITIMGIAQDARQYSAKAFGQRPGALLRMAADPSVQADIRLSDTKKQEIEELYHALTTAVRNCDCGKSNTNADDRKAKFEKLLVTVKGLDEKALSVLSGDDLIRVRQIVWREAGPFGLANLKDLVRELHLSEAQQRTIKTLMQHFEKEAQEMLSSKRGDRFDANVFAKKRKEAQDDILRVLSAGEQSKYKQLLGKPFTRVSKEGNTRDEMSAEAHSPQSEAPRRALTPE
jgi:hypothetical protein